MITLQTIMIITIITKTMIMMVIMIITMIMEMMGRRITMITLWAATREAKAFLTEDLACTFVSTFYRHFFPQYFFKLE